MSVRRNVCVRRVTTALTAACAIALPAVAAAQLPNNYYTPGKADKIDVKQLCAATDASTKPIADWQKNAALERYGVRPENFNGELERLVPVALGGTNDPDNLYPFHAQGEYTVEAKQRLAAKLHELVCEGKMSLKQAQDIFKKDWTKGYKQYVGAMNAPGGE